jgi:hypothetical protein
VLKRQVRMILNLTIIKEKNFIEGGKSRKITRSQIWLQLTSGDLKTSTAIMKSEIDSSLCFYPLEVSSVANATYDLKNIHNSKDIELLISWNYTHWFISIPV